MAETEPNINSMYGYSIKVLNTNYVSIQEHGSKSRTKKEIFFISRINIEENTRYDTIWE